MKGEKQLKVYNTYPCHDPFHLSLLLGSHGSKKKKKKNAITQCHNLKGKPDNLSRPEKKNADSIKYIEKM